MNGKHAGSGQARRIAAPDYLVEAVEQVQSPFGPSPGLAFSQYFRFWDDQWEVTKKEKIAAVQEIIRPPGASKEQVQALVKRARVLAQAYPITERVTITATTVAPFTTGLGNEHPLENGFAFLNPYGLPYLPGASIKGVLRNAARELAAGVFESKQGWRPEMVEVLFGSEPPEGEANDPNAPRWRGVLTFWDVVPELYGDKMAVDVMTPHQTDYYQNKGTPHDSGDPNPIFFLTVPVGSRFTFHVICDWLRLGKFDWRDRWRDLLIEAFEHAIKWCGFGAKTAVGYGAMEIDRRALSEQERELVEQQKAQAKARERAQAEAQRAQMSPLDAYIDDLIRADPSQADYTVLIKALEAGKVTREFRSGVVEWVKKRLMELKKWKTKSEKKNPAKDHDYQLTLRVQELEQK